MKSLVLLGAGIAFLSVQLLFFPPDELELHFVSGPPPFHVFGVADVACVKVISENSMSTKVIMERADRLMRCVRVLCVLEALEADWFEAV
jgi:hypothetical protein